MMRVKISDTYCSMKILVQGALLKSLDRGKMEYIFTRKETEVLATKSGKICRKDEIRIKAFD